MRYADSISTGALSLSPAFRVDWTRATLRATGTYAQLGDAGWTTQGTLGISSFTPSAGAYSGELVLLTGGSAHWDGDRTGQALGIARLHVDASAAGFWVGAGFGTTWDGAGWRSMSIGDIGLASKRGKATFLATTTPTVVDDTIKYLDTELGARWQLERFEAEASAGLRAGRRIPSFAGPSRTWYGASLTAWLTPRVALRAAGGTYPVDLTQGFPGGRYLTLAVRITTERSRDRLVNPASILVERPPGSRPGGMTAFVVGNGSGSERTFRVRAVGAAQVELAADFTSWRPLRLSPSPGGWWTLTLPIRPGTYQLNVRINGGEWLVPLDLLAIKDEFGGTAGLLLIR
jgi:hypothetical protein